MPRPRLAILPTGNELVAVGENPAAGQIRNSNGPMLVAAGTRAGADAIELGVARDTRDELTQRIQQGLAADVFVLSGGVSAGKFDLVPQVLAELGVEQVFHKIALRPGKPLWFGVKKDGERSVLVFGLPGNPVSSLVCFELFVRPAIAALAGRGFAQLIDGSRQAESRPRPRRRPGGIPSGAPCRPRLGEVRRNPALAGFGRSGHAGPGQRPGSPANRKAAVRARRHARCPAHSSRQRWAVTPLAA